MSGWKLFRGRRPKPDPVSWGEQWAPGKWRAIGMSIFAGDAYIGSAPSQKPSRPGSVPAMIPNPAAEEMCPDLLDDDDQCLANAQLMSAAPDLYAALKGIVDGAWWPDEVDPKQHDALIAARAAMLKALGRGP